MNDAPPSHYEEIAPAPSEEQLRIGLIKNQAYAFMAELHGWCPDVRAAFFIDVIGKTKPDVIVEIGVWGGKSLIPMACALKSNQRGIIFGIDPWQSSESVQWVMIDANRNFWQNANHEWVYQDLVQKIAQFHLENQIKLIKATSEAAPAIHGIDLLHIDGNHSDPTSYLDVTKWVPLVRAGGWIVLDDMTWSENGMATEARAVEWLNANCLKLAEFTDVSTWGVWIKP